MADQLIMKYSFLGILYFLIVCIRLVLFLVTHQVVDQLPLRFLGALFHDGPIGLFHLSKSFRETRPVTLLCRRW